MSPASASGARKGVVPMANIPMAARVTLSAPSSSTAQTAPVRAKSPKRRATSSTAKPHRPLQTGKRTPVSTSSMSSAVMNVDTKNSDAGTVRGPWVFVTSNSASRASATAGYSAAGSAWASDPPSVPRLRIWK